MHCLNCHTTVIETDAACPYCRVLLTAPGGRRLVKPVFAIAFLILGVLTYNFAAPPAEASARGVDLRHAFGAGLFGTVCAALGGGLDCLLSRRQ
jgi:hypothetical protein